VGSDDYQAMLYQLPLHVSSLAPWQLKYSMGLEVEMLAFLLGLGSEQARLGTAATHVNLVECQQSSEMVILSGYYTPEQNRL
jgi:hypothetical protein